MRTIDADALINELNNSHYPGAPYIDAGISIAIGKVCDAPTIEPEPHWIPCSDASTLPKDRTFWVTHMNGYEAWVGELYWDMTEWSDHVSDVVAYMPCNIPEPYREGE